MGNPASYRIVEDSADVLVIRDVGDWSRQFTITNDAERVVLELASRLRGRRLLYYDSEGDLAELKVEKGEFAGFGPAPGKGAEGLP